MDFADEPYVRKYTRKTVTSRLLGWEGRAVLDAMLGEFDAAGIFAIRGDAARCISAVTDIPLDIVRVALQRLVETETWIVTARVITWPTYEEAQNCRRSDRIRQRESRRARSAQSVTEITSGHTTSQPVTASHPPSHPPSAPSPPLSSSRGSAREPDPPSSPTVTEVITIAPVARLARFVPDTWAPKDAHRVRCQELRFDMAALEAAFRRHEFNRDYSDWDRRFSGWIEKEKTDRETALARGDPQQLSKPRRYGSAQPDAGKTGWEGLGGPGVIER